MKKTVRGKGTTSNSTSNNVRSSSITTMNEKEDLINSIHHVEKSSPRIRESSKSKVSPLRQHYHSNNSLGMSKSYITDYNDDSMYEELYFSPSPSIELEVSPNSQKFLSEQKDLKERVDEYLKEAFENRLASMMQLRLQMEELTKAQKQEEGLYVQTIKEILKRSNHEQEKRKETEHYLSIKLREMEGKLRQEYEEKSKTVNEFQSFKEKGTSIIMKLRDSLKKLTEKYKTEKHKASQLKKHNVQLEEELVQERRRSEKFKQLYTEVMEEGGDVLNSSQPKVKGYTASNSLTGSYKNTKIVYEEERQQNSSSDNEDEEDDELSILKEELKLEKQAKRKTERAVEKKLKEYQQIIEEEDVIIEDLKSKLSFKSKEAAELRKEIDRLKFDRGLALEVKNDNPTSINIPNEYLEMFTEIRGLLDPEDNKYLLADNSIDPNDKINAQNRLISLLLAKLKAEENDRIQSNENNQSVIQKKEEIINYLERKIKELEMIINEMKDQSIKERLRLESLIQGVVIDEDEIDENDERFKEMEKKLNDIANSMNNQSSEITKRNSIEDKVIIEEDIKESEENLEKSKEVVDIVTQITPENETENVEEQDDSSISSSDYGEEDRRGISL
ncbi:hypothetical protein ABK040_016904 [Willaertia magna]